MSEVLERPPTITKPRIVAYEDRFEAQVLALAREMHAESVMHRHIPMNEAKLLQQLQASHTLDHVYFRLCVRGDEVLGGFFGTISTLYFSDERCAKDLAWFVAKKRRGSLAAVMLVADFEKWAKAKGVKYFVLGQSTGVAVETTRALYEHLGYSSIGFNTFKRIA